MSDTAVETYVCCREWVVYSVFRGVPVIFPETGLPVKSCGLCGQVPVRKSEGQAPPEEAVS